MGEPNLLKKRIVFVFVSLLFFIGPAIPFTAEGNQLWTEKPESGEARKIIIEGDLFSRLAEELSPAVVNIRSFQEVDRLYGDSPFGIPQQPPSNQFEQRGEGSGFIIHKDGYILTNSHVVIGSDQVQVALTDGRLFAGTPIGIDTVTDIALIKIDATKPLPVLPLGSSERLKPGEWVMAIGSPFGLGLSVTVGIVSGKGRSLGSNPYDDFIQTDAPINPGNSGGPLINTRGEVVGINTAIIPQGQGLGFSLPIDLVKKIISQLKEKGRVVRSWLGVVVQDITIPAKEAIGFEVDLGSLVINVAANSPADKAGIKPNDVIIEFNGHPIKNSRELPKRIAHSPPGIKYPVILVRGKRTLKLSVILEEVPERNPQTSTGGPATRR